MKETGKYRKLNEAEYKILEKIIIARKEKNNTQRLS